MNNIYLSKVTDSDDKKIYDSTKKILNKFEEEMVFQNEIPLKVHFGEEGNSTFIEPKKYKGIIDYLKSKNIKSKFLETNVLYRGRRTKSQEHKNLAIEHGFTELPIEISNGFENVDINLKHFNKCKIGKEFSKYKQIIVISHFKGHYLTGFGGAIKQLAMGFASRSGKLDMHSGSKPLLNPLKCKKCDLCSKKCPENAIEIGRLLPRINSNCIGCAGCIAFCPNNAILINWLGGIGKNFNEKLAEYALASQKNKENIYFNFVMKVTRGCDCVGRNMKTITPDIGILASKDPVALDKASIDLLEKYKKFRGKKILDYSEKIGLGNKRYKIIEI